MEGGKYRVRYVSNAGIVLGTDGNLVGIDIFSRDPQGLYQETPSDVCEELLEEIEKGTLKLLIFTHGHGDHFDRELVQEALRRNPKLCIVSTEQVIRALSQTGNREGQLMKALRVKALEGGLWAIPNAGEAGAPRWIEQETWKIGCFYSLHEGEQYADVQNLSLLLQWDDLRIVIPGDAAPREVFFERIARWSKVIDLFFLPFPYVGIRSTRAMLANALKIRGAFVLHQPKPEADLQGWVPGAKRMCRRATDDLPMPLFPEGVGAWWDFEEVFGVAKTK